MTKATWVVKDLFGLHSYNTVHHHIEGSQDKNLEAGADAELIESHREVLLTLLLYMVCTACVFFIDMGPQVQ